MSFITIVDLEVFYRVGVSDEERSRPQRLLLTIDIKFDFSSAAVSGRVGRSIDYSEVAKHLFKLGESRSWRLIESVATDIANKILSDFHPESVTVEVKKFSLPEARYVSVSLTKQRPVPETFKRPLFWWQRWS
jgi:7,8-dihydroneopterin aldolase/epimerase/oxygenase